MGTFFVFLIQYLMITQFQSGIFGTGSCNAGWTNVFEHDANGVAVTGEKQALITGVLKGAELRIHVTSWGQGGYTAGVQNVHAIQGNICAQSLLHISKNGWNGFQEKAYWRFLTICTTGHVHMSRWYVGQHSQPSTGETKTTVGIKWYMRYPGCDGRDTAPTLSTTDDGTVIEGNIGDLAMDVSNGADVMIVNGQKGYSFSPDNIVYDNSVVAGQNKWHISQNLVSGHLEFQDNSYWWFTITASDGFFDMSRWNVGEHVSRGHTNTAYPFSWYVDPCWTMVYAHDEIGNPTDGSLDFLRSAALNGHRVKVIRGKYSIEADQLSIRSNHVNALVLGHISKASRKTFQDDAYWYWQIVSTTGKTRTYRYNVGNTTNRGNTEARENVSWFIDTRPWKTVLRHDLNGSVIAGSKQSLVEAVTTGAKVRYALKFPGASEQTTILPADNIDLGPNDNIGAQNVRSVSLANVGQNEFQLQANPYWWFTITSTDGNVAMSRWTVGEHVSRGANTEKAAVDWFVN